MSEHGQKQGPKEEPVIHADDLDELYPGRFLKAVDLHGREQTITITAIYGQRLEGKDTAKKQKTILVFERKTPGPNEIVLAKINGYAIKCMFGSKIKDIVGKRITIYGTNKLMPMLVGENANKDCIRIKGSPDIDREIPASFKSPRRKAVEWVLVPTGKTQQQRGQTPPPDDGPLPATPPDIREPGEDD